MDQSVYAVAICGYLAVAVVWPTIATWRRHGVSPVVFHREADPFQRVIGALMGLLILGFVLWGFLLWMAGTERLGVWPSSPWLHWGGWALMALGTLITVVAQRQMGSSWRIGIDDRPTKLVTRGLFRCCRNPIFSGMMVTLLGFVMIAPASWTIVGFLVACCLIAIQVRLEEDTLLRVHGLGYRVYASRVGRFVPLIGLLADDEDPARRRWAGRTGGPELPSGAPRHGGDQWS